MKGAAATASSGFSAAAALGGFSFQLHVAIQELCKPDVQSITFEGDEDVCATRLGSTSWVATQTKYHGAGGNLNPKHRDLWKTIRIWSAIAKSNTPAAQYRLVTTHTVADTGIGLAFRGDRSPAESATLETRLDEIAASKSEDEDVQAGMDAWASLPSTARSELASGMLFIKAETSFHQVRQTTIDALAESVVDDDEQYPLIEDLLQELGQHVLDDLLQQKPSPISKIQMLKRWGVICIKHGTGTPAPLYGALSVDRPEGWAVATPRFVRQLVAIKVPAPVVDEAQLCYLRAENEMRRLRRNAVGKVQVDSLEENLHGLWRQRWSMAVQKGAKTGMTDEEVGLDVFDQCIQSTSMLGNRGAARHESEGTLHRLADLPKERRRAIGWHPKFDSVIA